MDTQRKSLKIDRILALPALMVIIAAWLLGFIGAKNNVLASLKEIFPAADRFASRGENCFAAIKDDQQAGVLGYIKVASEIGYGGPITVAVAIDLRGVIIGISIIDNKETPAFFNRLTESGLIQGLTGKSAGDSFSVGRDVAAVSGATRSLRAVVGAVMRAGRDIARDQLKMEVAEDEKAQIGFGVLEATILVLFTIGFLARRWLNQWKNRIRWISILAGLVVIGFFYDHPVTVSMLNQFMLGFWPQWQISLAWYLLIIGFLVFILLEKKNPYCNWFCPFGAAQECLGAIGNARNRSAGPFRVYLKWFQRLLALVVIVIALLYRNPGLSSYEIFATFFELVGSDYQFILLGIVLVSALFIFRPWCSYLCPVRPVYDFVNMMRTWAGEIWLRKKQKLAG